MSQGGNAVKSGISGESKVNILISENLNITHDKITRLKYKACWYNTRMNENDFLFKINNIIVGGEVKNQNGGGSKDICVMAEVSNAFKKAIKSKKNKKNKCDKYFIVLAGSHWTTKRGRNIMKAAREDINIFSKFYGTSLDACKVILIKNFAKNLKELKK